jgi:hypothetical protein
LRAFGANPWQALELFDEARERFWMRHGSG